MRKFTSAFAATGMFAGLVCSASSAFAEEEYPTLNLQFAHYISENTLHGDLFKWWASEINSRSNGNITIRTFFSETLGKATELLELASAGAVNFTAPTPGYYGAKLPLLNVGLLPLVLSTSDEVHAVMNAIADTDGIKAEHERNGVTPLFWTSLPTYHVLCNTPIRTIADFRNKKMRSYGEYVPHIWSTLDAVGVNILLPEIYEGLHRGNIDCAFLPDDVSYTYALYEVADYYITADFGTILSWPIYVNTAQWNSWPENVRSLILEVSREAAERDRMEVPQFSEEAAGSLIANGMERIEFEEQAELDELLPDFLEMWVGRMRSQNLGSEAEEIAQVVREVLDSRAQE